MEGNACEAPRSPIVERGHESLCGVSDEVDVYGTRTTMPGGRVRVAETGHGGQVGNREQHGEASF